ncbi:hypothetical protein CP533_0800 [Ophiocordyceps camponoti-saundersi (nom. inval.)]|nr:hypothetical protein CP533_0800 [Ophiocordyceps camponoti-saundersi (nom. inval.)]
MRSLEETLSRWKTTVDCGDSLADLQKAVKNNGSASPCLTGCRSVCWKMFILSTRAGLVQALEDGRRDYDQRRSHFLNFIEHPEALAQLAVDPLTDDPESPWNTLRQDETMRKEIQQDVQRLPNEVNYHQDHVQALIINILFVYCKVNPSRGGYRQGMHELLAPIVHVMEQDAVDRIATGTDASSLDASMLVVLDSSYVEHDAYMLFSRLMEHAVVFYELKDVSTPSRSCDGAPEQRSTIVDKSRFIHEVCLRSVDEELATHLVDMEVLPQIFLIRWIRLLFSREFPLDQVLFLWDTIFAVDPTLQLIDFICCAMLLRIRWQLLEADYAVCLQLVLKYPQPAAPHGPHTFVDDAIYLEAHTDASGGSALIKKYSGREPDALSPSQRASRARTPSRQTSGSPRRRTYGGRSPLTSPPRFLQHPGGVESLFQGAAKSAKGVLERGEKLGLNSAVRDAVGEIRRNVQMFNESRQTSKSPRSAHEDEAAAGALAAMERRNKQLAALLEETVASLKGISMSTLEDKSKSLDAIELAAAKVQFVQLYLSDPSMEMAPAEVADEPEEVEEAKSKATAIDTTKQAADSDGDDDDDTGKAETTQSESQDSRSEPSRPAAPMPTRSTLAQSSFSWMLEPDLPSRRPQAAPGSKHGTAQHRKRPSSNASRDRNAFLFGEGTMEKQSTEDEIFGLEPINNKAKDQA